MEGFWDGNIHLILKVFINNFCYLDAFMEFFIIKYTVDQLIYYFRKKQHQWY